MNDFIIFANGVLIAALLILCIAAFANYIIYGNEFNINRPSYECVELCKSKHMDAYKSKSGGYSNAVCYCKTEEGEINTYVM